MNGERYRDPTADKAVTHADRTPEPVMNVVHMLRDIAGLAGFETVGRICLKDKRERMEISKSYQDGHTALRPS